MSVLETSEDYALWWMIAHTKDRMGVLRDRTLAKLKLSKAEVAILQSVVAINSKLHENATPTLIVKCILMTPHAVSQIITRMEKKGLLKKKTNQTGRRSVVIEVTKKGLDMLETGSTYRGDIYRVMQVLSDEERKIMWNALYKLRKEALRESGIMYEPLFPDLLGFPAKRP